MFYDISHTNIQMAYLVVQVALHRIYLVKDNCLEYS